MIRKPHPGHLPPVPRENHGRTILLVSLLIAATPAILAGCAERPSAPPAPGVGARLTLMQPADGDTVAGVIRCVASWEGHAPPDRISFIADGHAVDTATNPPWEAVWRPAWPPPGGAEHRLGARAWTADGARIDAAQVTVWVVPDSSPRVTLDPHPRTIWMRRDKVGALRAQAYDPEDGPLPCRAISWTGSHMTAAVTGDSLALAVLPDADQTVTATARDRRGQEGSATLRVRPFLPMEPSEPGYCRFNLEAALQALDPDLLEDQLAAGFTFVPCRAEAERAGWGLVWPGDVFLMAVRAWAARPSVLRPEWTWAPGPLMIWSAGGGRQAWQHFRNTSLAFDDASGTAPERILLARGEAALWMTEDAGGKWRILEWRDLPSDNETSLASLIAAAAGMPVPGPGLGCAPAPSPDIGPRASRP